MSVDQTDLPKKPLIFISHSSKDKLIADAICSRLENQGIRCWIAPRDVNPGRDYSDQIQEALERSTVMVIVLSSGSNTSRHVKSEIDRAFSLGQIIIPFRVENIELDKGLAYYLAKTHWLDAVTPPLNQHIDRLATTIHKLSTPDVPAATPTRATVPAFPEPAQSNKRLLLILAGVVALGVLSVGAIALLTAHRTPIPTSRTNVTHDEIAKPSSTLEAQPTPAKNLIEGAWAITEARTLQGSAYGGTVQFFKQRDRYHVTWQTAAGNYSGVALTRGNKLCVGWSERPFGVVFYRINDDGTMNGNWTLSGAAIDQSDGTEKAVGGTPGMIEGDYSVSGSNPGSQGRYGGKLRITLTGETYQMRWEVENSVITGVAIKVGEDLFAVFGDKNKPFGVVAYTFDGERAKGLWTLGGESQVGTEDLIKQ